MKYTFYYVDSNDCDTCPTEPICGLIPGTGECDESRAYKRINTTKK